MNKCRIIDMQIGIFIKLDMFTLFYTATFIYRNWEDTQLGNGEIFNIINVSITCLVI